MPLPVILPELITPRGKTLDFASSASIGRLSQADSERVASLSFTGVYLTSHLESLSQFDSVFFSPPTSSAPYSCQSFDEQQQQQQQNRQHQRLVTCIQYHVVLPTVSAARRANKRRQSRRESAANDAAFSRGILALLTRLASWAQDDGRIELYIRVSCPDDDVNRRHTREGRDENHYLKYIDSSDRDRDTLLRTLPEARCVGHLEVIRGPHSREVHPLAMELLLGRCFPCLKVAKWSLAMPRYRNYELRRELRIALGDVLLSPGFGDSLRELNVVLSDYEIANQRPERLHDYCSPSGERCLSVINGEVEAGASIGGGNDDVEELHGHDDRLSLGIKRVLSLPNLTKVELLGSYILSLAAFSAPEFPLGFGPSLSYVHIDVAQVTASGKWLMTGGLGKDNHDNDDGDDESSLCFHSSEEFEIDMDDVAAVRSALDHQVNDSDDSAAEDEPIPGELDYISYTRWLTRENLGRPFVHRCVYPDDEEFPRLLIPFVEAARTASSSSPQRLPRRLNLTCGGGGITASVRACYLAAGEDTGGHRDTRPDKLAWQQERIDRARWSVEAHHGLFPEGHLGLSPSLTGIMADAVGGAENVLIG